MGKNVRVSYNYKQKSNTKDKSENVPLDGIETTEEWTFICFNMDTLLKSS